MSADRRIAYAHPSHEEHNKRLVTKTEPRSSNTTGPWLSSEVLNRLPDARRDFGREATRETIPPVHGGESGRGSSMVEKDAPRPRLHPQSASAQSVDHAEFKKHWLEEQRQAAFAAAARLEAKREQAREIDNPPSRENEIPQNSLNAPSR
jgi:hypothetical protein